MKRLITLLLTAGLMLSVSYAHAVDIKVSGLYTFGFSLQNDMKGNGGAGCIDGDTFNARQRLRTQIDIIANEYIRGIVYFEIGDQVWGDTSTGSALGADGTVVEVRRSYMDWTPNDALKIRMGIQGIYLPVATAKGSLLFGEDVAGVTASYTFSDRIAATAMWLRPYDGNSDDGSDEGSDEMDMFGLVLPMSFDGHSFRPYFVYSTIGLESEYGKKLAKANATFNDDAGAFWAGFAYSMTAYDPFRLDLDFVYGTLDGGDYSQDGFVGILKASYALDSMTPAFLAWYGTGDSNEADHGAMPIINNAALWMGSSLGYRDLDLGAYDRQIGKAPNGSWALGFEIDDISFVDDLKHLLRFIYSEGTHNVDAINAKNDFLGVYLTDHDKAWEVNVNSSYKIYENLTLNVDLGYMEIDFKELEDQYISCATMTLLYRF